MRPALERLLARPSALEFLQVLVHPERIIDRRARRRPFSPCVRCFQSQSAVGSPPKIAQNTDVDIFQNDLPAVGQSTVGQTRLTPESTALNGLFPRERPRYFSIPNPIPKLWSERMFTSEELEYESNLEPPADRGRQKLVDYPPLTNDMGLWLLLLKFRLHRYGNDGTSSIWRAIRTRGLHIPVDGKLASQFWTPILELGLTNESILLDVCRYANEMYDAIGLRWEKLYVFVMQRLLLEGRTGMLRISHDLLRERHAPSPLLFQRFMRNMILAGDFENLKSIYRWNRHRNAYAKVITALLGRQDFKSAIEWHFFLIRHGDKPSEARIVEPLVHHLAIYDPKLARRVTQSLVSAGTAFAPTMADDLGKSDLISREMMNLIHGETYNIGVKKYNDKLGARWFATRWVGLELAISTIHALGVQTIGPLSLQSIAIREADPEGVLKRIRQLQELGISIGDSVFSKAIEWFAEKNDQQNLKGLLESDQHPDSLEDWKLQEALMASYARAGDWTNYRLTEAIRLAGLRAPEFEKHNIVLRRHLATADYAAILRTVEDMRMRGIAVKPRTLRYMLCKILRPRSPGKRPSTVSGHANDLDMAISILQTVMSQGNLVPVVAWREILRRLGMAGRLDELDQLCIWLAQKYNPNSIDRLQSVARSPWQSSRHGAHLPPAQVPTWHDLHPLRILFPMSLHKAIIEWGFIHTLLRLPDQKTSANSTDVEYNTAVANKCVRGLRLLLQLKQHGVHMQESHLRRALYTRLVILYGPGMSNKIYNRRATAVNPVDVERMTASIDLAWGGRVFPDSAELKKKIANHGAVRRAKLTSPQRPGWTEKDEAQLRDQGHFSPEAIAMHRAAQREL